MEDMAGLWSNIKLVSHFGVCWDNVLEANQWPWQRLYISIRVTKATENLESYPSYRLLSKQIQYCILQWPLEKFKDQERSALEGNYVPLVVPIATTSLLAQSNVKQDVSSSSILSNGWGSFTKTTSVTVLLHKRIEHSHRIRAVNYRDSEVWHLQDQE